MPNLGGSGSHKKLRGDLLSVIHPTIATSKMKGEKEQGFTI